MKKFLLVSAIIFLSITACKSPENQEDQEKPEIPEPQPQDITYDVSQTGGSDNTATSTGIVFTFSEDIDSLNVTANDITVSGTASKGTAAFSGSGKSWTLSPITVNSAGEAAVDINKAGIEVKQKKVIVHKQTQDTPPGTFNDISAAELVANIKLGWNLGNTLDAHGLDWLGPNPTVSAIETAWGNPVTTKANIDALKEGGFNGIRIPVSWTNVTDSNFNIRADWMARVKAIANYAVSNDMYIIINTHHDEGVIKFRNSEMEESKKAFKKLWEQIADAFKDYNEKLIFEGLNEPRTPGSAAEWNGGTAEERNNINILEQLFVDTVRASGGNNVRRMLLISGYAASASQTVLNAIVLPNDPLNEKNKFIVSIHAYEPYNFALNKNSPVNTWSKTNSSDTTPITGPIDRAYNTFASKGIPVIIGEFGAMNKENEAVRAEWAKFYVEYAAGKGMPCFWWDNGVTSGDDEKFGLLDRKTNNFSYPLIISAMTGETPTTNPNPTITITFSQDEGGWRNFYELNGFLNGGKITQGDKYTFTYTFTSNVAMDRLELALIDQSSVVSYWKQLSAEWAWARQNIPANTQVSGTQTFTANATATDTSGTANKLLLRAGDGTASAPTLTFTNFKFEKTN
jgi:endoglucanase